MNEMGQRIKELRLANGYTQEKLGKLVGVNKTCIAKWENGKVENMKSKTLMSLAKALNVKATYIMCLDDSENSTQDKLISLVKTLDIEQQEKALAVLIAMFK